MNVSAYPFRHGSTGRDLKALTCEKTVMCLPRTLGIWAFFQVRDMCGEMGEIEKQNVSCTMERYRKEEMKVVWSRLRLEVCLSLRAMVMSGLGDCQRPCLGSWSSSRS